MIVVYTALLGDIDCLWPPLPSAMAGAKFVCFSDRPRREMGLWTRGGRGDSAWHILEKSGTMLSPGQPHWEVREESVPLKSPEELRRRARWYKTLPHVHFPEAEITIWLDANARLLIPAGEAVEKWLGSSDFAVCNHPERDCLYDEAAVCAQQGKARKEDLETQTAYYRKQGMPRNGGLASTRCLIRRNSPEIRGMNEAWWHEILTRTLRDQVSLPFVCWNLGLEWTPIPGHVGRMRYISRNPDFFFVKHSTQGRGVGAPPYY